MRNLKIESLQPKNENWVDRDIIMLHACFQILKDSVEKEHVDTHMNYATHKDTVDEIRFLYNWWIERVKNEKNINQFDRDKEEDEMLIRLMGIRKTLWS